MQQPPGEDARRVVGEEVAGDEEQQPGNDRRVQRKPVRLYFAPFLAGGITRAPQEQTMLRVGQKMLSSRPQAGQPRYVPAGRGEAAMRGGAAPNVDFTMGSPVGGPQRNREPAYAAAIRSVKGTRPLL